MDQALWMSVCAMNEDGANELSIRSFCRAYQLGKQGVSLLSEDQLEPMEPPIPLARVRSGVEPMGGDKVVALTLNGGLGTSMGLTGPKGLVQVQEGRSFLDHAISAAAEAGTAFARMDSFRTADACRRIPLWTEHDAIVQSRIPRLDEDTWRPVEGLAEEERWTPPGHGDLFLTLQTSGALDRWIREGRTHLFVSNVDNLGAVPDPAIAAWMQREGVPMVMEATRRTVRDRKGGHLARIRGRLVLRELAQACPEELEQFQDTDRHQWFNTNNLWFDLRLLREALVRVSAIAPLPVMCNRKQVVDRMGVSRSVIQLETAMGAAIRWLPGARVIGVSRKRFRPAKTVVDLLILRSDAEVCNVDLDPAHCATLSQLEQMCPYGVPSLRDCASLSIRGPVVFGRDVVCRDHVVLRSMGETPLRIPDGAVLGERGVLAA